MPLSALPNSAASALVPLAITRGLSHPILTLITLPTKPYTIRNSYVESIEKQRSSMLHIAICRHILSLKIPLDSSFHEVYFFQCSLFLISWATSCLPYRGKKYVEGGNILSLKI
jgi:hypothetical protein